jgi:hypothetical protein
MTITIGTGSAGVAVRPGTGARLVVHALKTRIFVTLSPSSDSSNLRCGEEENEKAALPKHLTGILQMIHRFRLHKPRPAPQ